MFYSLEEMFKLVCKNVEEKAMRVASINNLGGRVIVVIEQPNAEIKKQVQVVDLTKTPESTVPEAPAPTAGTPVKTVEPEDREAYESTHCAYCDREVTSRGKTRHENKCPKR
jgi:hypothetical protein